MIFSGEHVFKLSHSSQQILNLPGPEQQSVHHVGTTRSGNGEHDTEKLFRFWTFLMSG